MLPLHLPIAAGTLKPDVLSLLQRKHDYANGFVASLVLGGAPACRA